MSDPPRMPSALDVARRMTGLDVEVERDPPAPRALTQATRRKRPKPSKPSGGSGGSTGQGVMADYIAKREEIRRKATAEHVRTVETIQVPHAKTHGVLGFSYDQHGPHTAGEGEPLLTAGDAMEAARRLQATGEWGSCVLQGRRKEGKGKKDAIERWMVRAENATEFGDYSHFPLMPERAQSTTEEP